MERNQTILITGASQGIGAGLVNTFLERGYNVVATSRHVSRSAEIKASSRLALVDGDIGDPATAKKVAETAIKTFGSIDAVVNNAGIFVAKPFVDYTIEDFRKLSSTNLDGFIHLTQLAIRHMLAQRIRRQHRQHHVVVGRSSHRRRYRLGGDDHQRRYRRDLQKPRDGIRPDGIRVNTVAPGVVDTPLHKDNPKEFLKTLSPMASISDVQEIVDAVRLPDRGAARNRGGAARRWRRTFGQMVDRRHGAAGWRRTAAERTRHRASSAADTFGRLRRSGTERQPALPERDAAGRRR